MGRHEVAGPSLLWRSADCRPLSAQGCQLCAEACPAGALTISAGVPAASSQCTGCARCTAACPTDALQMEDFPAPVAPAATGSAVFIDCMKVPRAISPAGTVRVPCMGGLSPGWLLTLQDRIGNVPITALDRGWCAHCSAGDSSSFSATNLLADATQLLKDAGAPADMLPRSEHRPLPLSRMPDAIPPSINETAISRRAFFTRTLSEMASAAANRHQPEEIRHFLRLSPLRTMGRVVPAEQVRRVTALSNISHRYRTSPATFNLPALAISRERCENHQVCAVTCPTSALTKYGHEGATGIRFNALLCIGCRQCERGCPEQAIRLSLFNETPPHAMEINLTNHQVNVCATCEDEFSGIPGDVCTACRKTEALFAGRATLDKSIGKPAA